MLFVTDTRSVEYLNKHLNVLLLNCTYKTNKFNILLLNILSVNHYNHSFYYCLVFFRSGDYCWNSGMQQFRLLYICLSEQQHMTLSAPVHLSAAYI
jgi:hypothetical protein